MFSDTYVTRKGTEVELPKFDEDCYVDFMEKLIFGTDQFAKKRLLMEPLPPEINQLFFVVVRDMSFKSKLTPIYDLFLEKGGG